MVVTAAVDMDSLRASATMGLFSECKTVPIGLLRKREATGRAMKDMVRKMRSTRPAFMARLLMLLKSSRLNIILRKYRKALTAVVSLFSCIIYFGLLQAVAASAVPLEAPDCTAGMNPYFPRMD